MICTFFGHRDAPTEICVLLEDVLIDLIENQEVDMFYVGNQGRFDSMVRRVLIKLKKRYSHIRYAVVLAYLPDERDPNLEKDVETIYPEGLETVPRRFSISRRNQWMVEQSQIAVTYVVVSYGGAAQFQELARKKGKRIINLYQKIRELNEKKP